MLSSGFGLSSSVFTYFNIGKSITSQVNLVLTSLEIVQVLLREIEEYHLLTMVVSCCTSKVTSDGCLMDLLTVGRQRYKTGKEY